MPRVLRPAVVAVDIRAVGIAYAREMRGNPLVDTPVEIFTYHLVDAAGEVLEIHHVGEVVSEAVYGAGTGRMAARRAQSLAAEGI